MARAIKWASCHGELTALKINFYYSSECKLPLEWFKCYFGVWVYDRALHSQEWTTSHLDRIIHVLKASTSWLRKFAWPVSDPLLVVDEISQRQICPFHG